MTLLVIDSGAALRAAASVEAREALRGTDLIAPPLLWSEVTSALHEALWRRELTAAEADEHRQKLGSLDIRRQSPAALHTTAWQLAGELGWAKTYDAEFLALARLRETKVLTTDARLRRGAVRTGLVMDPSELGRASLDRR